MLEVVVGEGGFSISPHLSLDSIIYAVLNISDFFLTLFYTLQLNLHYVSLIKYKYNLIKAQIIIRIWKNIRCGEKQEIFAFIWCQNNITSS